jgi:DNA-binding Lrp family transcriptional regulator
LPTAFVFINTEPASMPEVLKKVKAIEGVEEAGMVYGVYDIVAKVKTETMDRLKHIITYKIRTIVTYGQLKPYWLYSKNSLLKHFFSFI